MKTPLPTLLILLISLGGLQAAKEADAGDGSSWTTTPTRFLGKSEEDFIQAMKARLAISGRVTGPFGRSQDPSEDKVAPVFTGTRPKIKKFKTPFADVVKSINVSTVSIQDRSFYVEGHVFRVGQELTLLVKNERVKVRIDSVNATAISFTNLKSGEQVEKRLDLFPEGVSSGGGQITVSGVTATGGSQEAVLKVNLSNERPNRP